LLSPNYPWYFLAIVPFVALCGNAPTWVVSIGALLLTDEVRGDFQIPKLVVKSILFGGCLLAYVWSAQGAYQKHTATGRPTPLPAVCGSPGPPPLPRIGTKRAHRGRRPFAGMRLSGSD